MDSEAAYSLGGRRVAVFPQRCERHDAPFTLKLDREEYYHAQREPVRRDGEILTSALPSNPRAFYRTRCCLDSRAPRGARPSDRNFESTIPSVIFDCIYRNRLTLRG